MSVAAALAGLTVKHLAALVAVPAGDCGMVFDIVNLIEERAAAIGCASGATIRAPLLSAVIGGCCGAESVSRETSRRGEVHAHPQGELSRSD
jgi:hypothetical protein